MRRRFAEGRIESPVGFVLPILRDGSRQRDGSHVAAQFGSETLTELFYREIALNVPADGEADGSGFFRANDGDSIGLFSNTDAGAVASVELRRQQRIHGKRQKACGSRNTIFLHD